MNTQAQIAKTPQNNQGVLFSALPRQLPILKSGPEDEPKAPVKH